MIKEQNVLKRNKNNLQKLKYSIRDSIKDLTLTLDMIIKKVSELEDNSDIIWKAAQREQDTKIQD